MKRAIQFFCFCLLMGEVVFAVISCSQPIKNNKDMEKEAYKKTMNRLVEDVWNKQNLAILPEVFTENAVLHDGGTSEIGGQDLKGIPDFRENYMRTAMKAFPDIQHEVTNLFIDGNKIAMRFKGQGIHKGEFYGVAATNKMLRYEGIAIFKMEGNRIAEVWTNSNFGKQLAALEK